MKVKGETFRDDSEAATKFAKSKKNGMEGKTKGLDSDKEGK